MVPFRKGQLGSLFVGGLLAAAILGCAAPAVNPTVSAPATVPTNVPATAPTTAVTSQAATSTTTAGEPGTSVAGFSFT